MSWATRLATLAALQGDLTSSYRLVFPMGQMPIVQSTVVGADRVITSRIVRTWGATTTPEAFAPVFQLAGMSNSGAGGDVLLPNPTTVSASIERVSTGQVAPFTFGGSLTATGLPGTEILGDLMSSSIFGSANLAANNFWVIKTMQTFTPGAGFLGGSVSGTTISSPARSEQSVFFNGPPAVDSLYTAGQIDTTGAIASSSTGMTFAGMYGRWAAGQTPLLAGGWLGDSIQDRQTGTGGTGSFNYNGSGGVSIEQALRSAHHGFTKMALGSSRLSDFPNSPSLERMMRFFDYLIVGARATNDLAGGLTAAQCWELEKQIYAAARRRGVRKLLTMGVIPRGSTNNSLVDAAGQAVSGAFAPGGEADLLNAMRLANVGAPDGPTAFISDYHTVVADPVEPKKALTDGTPWKYYVQADNPNYIHLSASGHALAAAPILTALMAL